LIPAAVEGAIAHAVRERSQESASGLTIRQS